MNFCSLYMPLCSPLSKPLRILKFTLRGAFERLGISLVATSDQRCARWISALFLKKEGQKLLRRA
jgi:hypothetical protein